VMDTQVVAVVINDISAGGLPAGLQKLCDNFPDLPSCVSSTAWNHLKKEPTEAFENDLEYVETVISMFEVLYVAQTMEHKITSYNAFPTENKQSAKHLDAMRCTTQWKNMIYLHSYAKDLINKRVEACEVQGKLVPRCERLAKLVDLTEKEKIALIYICFSYKTQEFSGTGFTRSSFDFSAMCKFSELTIEEGFRFLLPSRKHVKEGIFSPDEENLWGYSFNVPYITCTILCGQNPSEEDLLKIDKTPLAEVLKDEDLGEVYSLWKSADSIPIMEMKSEDEDVDDGDIYDFLRKEVEIEKEKEIVVEEENVDSEESSVEKKITKYTSNIEYLSDVIDWLANMIRMKNTKRSLEDDMERDGKKEQQLRELTAKVRQFKNKLDKRLYLTHQAGTWTPRTEKLAKKMGLDNNEKVIILLLTCNVITPKVNADLGAYHSSSSTVSLLRVGELIHILCESFEEEIYFRRYFYKCAKLVKEGIIRIENDWEHELMNAEIELDRRMLDFIVGLDTEVSELVEGSHLYSPEVDLDRVVLPDETKGLIIRTCENFEKFVKARATLGFDEVISYGRGIMILFYGKSGTGKTMMANAVAKMLGKKILLINYPSLGGAADYVIRFIFREAKLTDSVLFFDECESIFMSRDKCAGSINLLLTEIERHSGLIIMATNRAFDLDEAMHRRITLAVEFRNPDPHLRTKIWESHLPKNLKRESDVNLEKLAIRFELTGGLIKNAIISALSEAVARNPEAPIISQSDLETGAVYQLRGSLAMQNFDRRIVPVRGLQDLIVPDKTRKQLSQIINMEKARQVLFSEWGFSEKMCHDQGTTCLFYGPPGVGKSLAAEAIGFETGKPLKAINCAELVSKYVGDTGKNIEAVFTDAKNMDAIIIFDDAESLFSTRSHGSSATDKHSNMDTGLLLYNMEHFPGIAILTTNCFSLIDPAFYRRFRFFVEFEKPDAKTRERLWQSHLPSQAPLADDVDLQKLANLFDFSGAVIKNCCFKAAAQAALRVNEAKRKIYMKDLLEVAEEEREKNLGGDKTPEAMFL